MSIKLFFSRTLNSYILGNCTDGLALSVTGDECVGKYRAYLYLTCNNYMNGKDIDECKLGLSSCPEGTKCQNEVTVLLSTW